MTVGPLVVELIVVFCISLLLLHHYGRLTKQHSLVTVATLTAWYFSLIIVFILPLDVSSTFYRQCVQTSKQSTSENNNSHAIIKSYNISFNRLQKKGEKTAGSDFNFTTTTSYNSSSIFNDSTEGEVFTSTFANSLNVTYFPTNQTASTNYTTQVAGTNSQSSTDLTTATGSGNNCVKPWSYVPDTTLPAMWRIVYWTSQLLTWLVLPFMQSYACAGDFSALGKVKRAVIENAFYYGSYLIIFVFLLIYVAVSPHISLDINQLKVILITASNTWGLFLLVLLLGYGLVEVPRRVWYAADVDRTLAQTYFRLAKLSTEKQEAAEDLNDVLEDIKKASDAIRYNHPFRKFVNIIISKCPDEFQKQVSRGMDDYQDFNETRPEVPSEPTLVRLHRKVIGAANALSRTHIQWRIIMGRAFHLESIKTNAKSSARRWKSEFEEVEQSQDGCAEKCCTPCSKWYWYCIFQPKIRKVLAICLAILSAMVVWSECTFFTQNPVLSLFAIFINLAKKNYDYFYIELASCLIISYLCVCAYYTVFRIKIFNYYYIAGHHQTDEASLLFVGIMLCRLTAPLCLNFLGMIHLDTHIAGSPRVETSYTKIMGHLDVIYFIAKGFNIYFPILVCVLCAATYFNLGQRCLSAIGFQRFIDAADDMTSDMVEEGKQLVSREKRRLQREVNSRQRTEWQSEYCKGSDFKTRQWKGRTMQQAENEAASSGQVHYSRKKSDKVELLNDAEPIDYSSTKKTETGADLDDTVWEKPSQWGAGRNASLSSRPPKNLFDDV